MNEPTTNTQKYIQMSNLTSGSGARSSFRSRTSEIKQNDISVPVYNFPWDVKIKQNSLMTQSLPTVPPPLPSVPPPKISEPEPTDETQYCAPWDLKLQEEMLKMMTQKTNEVKSETSFKRNEPTTSSFKAKNIEPEPEASEYSPPWEHKQNILLQQLSNTSNKSTNIQMPQPLATSSASSTLTNQNPNGIGSLINKMSLTRLSTRSNNSSSSSTRSSTSSLSTNSPPSMPPPALPPPILPPPPPPPPSSTVPTNHSPMLSHRSINNQTNQFNPIINTSNYLNDKNSKFQTTQSSLFDTIGSNSSGSPFDDTKQIIRQNRAGSSHHFSYPQPQFQTISNGDIQVSALPVTALVFSQTNSLPNGILPINVQQQAQLTQMSSPSGRHNELERQPWFHGRITRKHAEVMLNNRPIGSFLVRQSESGNSNDYSLSLVSGSGCVHMRICMKNGEFILGQCSQPFSSIVKMIDHYGRVEVPIKGAQHVKLCVAITPSG